MKNVIVIGADNALGHALLKLLIEKKISSTAIVPPSSANKNAVPTAPLIKFAECKASDLPSFSKNLLEDYDAVFYLYSDDPVKAAPVSAELAVRLGCKVFIGVGSQAELRPFEDDPYGAVMLAAGKICAELCRKNNVKFSWFRLSNIFGAYDNEESFVSSNLIRLVSGEEQLLLPDEDGEFDLISAADAAQALFLAASSQSPKEFYDLISGAPLTAAAFAEKMGAAIAPGIALSYANDSSLKLFKNGAEATLTDLSNDTGFSPALVFEDALLSAVPWAGETWDKNKKKAHLCQRICDTALKQYDSGDLQGSLKGFFQILGFKKYLYTEALDALNQIFAENNKDFYKENFDFNLNYFAEQGLADFEIEPDNNSRLYYAGDLIRLHEPDEQRHMDLDIREVDKENPPKHLKVSITYAGIIIDCDETFSQSLEYAEEHYKNTDIYIMARSLPLLKAYMQLMKFNETELRIVKIFSSAAEMEGYFRVEHNRYLPKSVISRDKDLTVKLLARLNAVSVFRRDIERDSTDKITLTIAIPSYMRPKLLLEKIKHILTLKRDIEFELFVAVNAWYWMEVQHPELCAEIDAIKDSRLRILKREPNIGPETFIEIVEKSYGKYCFMISDEDFFNIKIFDELIQKLSDLEGVSVLRTKGTYQNHGLDYTVYKKGAEALLNFNFNNYISGTIYNRELFELCQAGAKARVFLRSSNAYAYWYTIPTMDIYMCTAGDIIVDDMLTYLDEGPQSYYENLEYNKGIPMLYARPVTRIIQYEYYTDVLLDVAKLVDYVPSIVYGMFINYSARNFFLIHCVQHILENLPEGSDPAYIQLLEFTRAKAERFNKEYFPLAGIEENSPGAAHLTKIFHQVINEAALKYLKEPDKYAFYFN